MSDHSATTLSGSPSKQQPAAAVSPVDEKAAASPQGHHPATPAYPTGEKAAVDNATRSPPAPPMQSLPTLKDIHSNPRDLEARRVRSRALSQSTVPGDVSLGRALSRVISPPVAGMFGGLAPGDDDLSGLPPPRESAEVEREEERRVNELAGGEPDWEVSFDGPKDPANPKNWSVAYRWMLTAFGGILVLNATFASSAPSGVIPEMIVYFGFGREVATLLIALFVAGYCVGPLLWGPASESFGRRPVFIATFIVYSAMQIGCALSKNTASILIFRFIGGTFAACPLTNAGALIADIWDQDRRGIALAFFSLAPFAGPAIGPIVGGFMAVRGQSWRNLFWVLFAFAGACLVLIIVAIPETYVPIILKNKAQKMRKDTGETRYYAPIEKADTSIKARAQNILVKPFKMLVVEPMLLAVTIYMSFVYGVLYLLFEAFPIVYSAAQPEGHGFNAGLTGLMFLPLFVGGAVAVAIYVFYFNPRYVRQHHAYTEAGKPVPPELRLEMAYPAAFALIISLFWFGWSSYSFVHWASPMMATGLLGLAILFIFLSMFNYLIDVYLFHAASCLAANTVCRSLFGAAFPLFATQMFETLNPRIASTVLGAIAILLAPIPFLFKRYGSVLRGKSRFSPVKV